MSEKRLDGSDTNINKALIKAFAKEPIKSGFTESPKGANMDKVCICTERPLKDKRKEIRISPSGVLGIDKTPPVTSRRPDKNETVVFFSKSKHKESHITLKTVKFAQITAMVLMLFETANEKDAGKSFAEGRVCFSASVWDGKEVFGPLVKRAVIRDENR